MTNVEKNKIDTALNQFFKQQVVYQPQIDSFRRHLSDGLSKKGIQYLESQIQLFKTKSKRIQGNSSLSKGAKITTRKGAVPNDDQYPNEVFSGQTKSEEISGISFRFSKYVGKSWSFFFNDTSTGSRQDQRYIEKRISNFSSDSIIENSDFEVVSEYFSDRMKALERKNRVSKAKLIQINKYNQKDKRYPKINPNYKGIGKIIYIASKG